MALEDTPDWFKSAVFYEVLVRSFRDSDGDGIGDFKGLTEKLDYLQWLGVDCLWVPPFFTSPLRDKRMLDGVTSRWTRPSGRPSSARAR